VTTFTSPSTVTSSTTWTTTLWNIQVRDNLLALNRFIVPAIRRGKSGTATLDTNYGNYGVDSLASNAADGTLYFNFRVPANYVSAKGLYLRCISPENADFRYSGTINWGRHGESILTGAQTITAATQATGAVDQWLEIDLLAYLTGLTAGAEVGVAFSRLGTNVADTINTLYVAGLDFEYSL
jgi:hypothetical protein